VIGYHGDYVLVEISVQALNRGIAAGDPASITRRCAGYHAKADQAEAMARRLGELVRAYDLPAVRSWTYLVVTDQALPGSPALADALRRIRPPATPASSAASTSSNCSWTPATVVGRFPGWSTAGRPARSSRPSPPTCTARSSR
jgi:hypothetical protein